MTWGLREWEQGGRSGTIVPFGGPEAADSVPEELRHTSPKERRVRICMPVFESYSTAFVRPRVSRPCCCICHTKEAIHAVIAP